MTVDELARMAFGDKGYDWLVEATRRELLNIINPILAVPASRRR